MRVLRTLGAAEYFIPIGTQSQGWSVVIWRRAENTPGGSDE